MIQSRTKIQMAALVAILVGCAMAGTAVWLIAAPLLDIPGIPPDSHQLDWAALFGGVVLIFCGLALWSEAKGVGND